MTHQYKVGDLVRVKRHGSHGVKFGAVCELESLNFWSDPANPIPAVQGPIMEGWNQDQQILSYRDIEPAKQAMRKRDEYQNRRG